MPATPAIQEIGRTVRLHFPDVGSMGVYNKRHIGRNRLRPWSQHAGAEPSLGFFGNAWDITSPASVLAHGSRAQSNRVHMEYLDQVHALLDQRRTELRINHLIWRTRDHWDHIHVDAYPAMVSDFWRRHPTDGGPVLTRDRSGDRANTYVLGGDGMARGLRRGDEGRQVELLQRLLNKAPHPPAPPLVEDGVFGQATEQAVLDWQKRREIIDADGVYDAFTRTDLERQAAD